MFKAGGATMAIALVAALAIPTAVEASQGPDYLDDFDGPVLDAGWTLVDHYAEAFPSDTGNHASFALEDGRLVIDIPGGAEHNMWDLRHAEAKRAYEGSGVYQIKMDSDFSESQQFGLIFESSPGTFLLFMLYAHNEIHAYVERFVQVGDGPIYKKTTHGLPTGLYQPHDGPYYLRVAVDDNPVHTERTWSFEWSLDGANWNLAADGVFEGSDATEDVRDIQTVSVFAGNQPYQFSAFEARFDYFYSTPDYLPAPLPSPTVAASSSATQVDLTWNEVYPTDEYRVYRATEPGGPSSLIATPSEPSFSDLDVASETYYYYTVSVVRDGVESGPSEVAIGFPHATGLEVIPSDGLELALLASELALELGDGAPVRRWASSSGTGYVAESSGGQAPVFVSSGIGGVPSVRFDGVDDYLSLGAGFDDFTAGMSMFVVAQPSVLQPGSKLVALGNGAGQQNIGFGRAGSSSGLQYFTTQSGGSFGWFDTSGGLVAGEAAVYSVSQAGGVPDSVVTASVRRDGVELGSGSVYVPPVATRGVNYIGKSYWSDGAFQGDVAEVLIYDRELTPAEYATVTEYLSTKYSIDSQPPPASPPAVPVGVTATAGDATATVAWESVQDSVGYRVYRAGQAAGPYEIIADVVSTTTAYVDGGVVNGQTYHYAVSAYGAGGESAMSTSVSVAPEGSPPPPPVGIPLDGLVLSLDASVLQVADGAAVSVWRSNAGDADAVSSGGQAPVFVSSGIGGVPSVRFDGVDDYLSLGAGFDDFTAGMSMFVVAQPSVLQPGSKLVALGNGAGQQNIGFGRAGSSSGLQYFTTQSGGSFGWFDTSGGLVAGEAAVYSVSQAGGVPDSVVTASVRRDGVELGSGSVYVPPVATRGVNYIGKSYWSDGAFQGDVAEVLIYDRELTPAEYATVTEYLSTKYSIDSPPAVPVGVTATAGDATATVAWESVQDSVGYRVYRAGQAAGPYEIIADVVSTTTAYVDGGVVNGQTYHYAVSAYGAGGESAMSTSVSATPEDPAPVGIPLDGLVLSLDASVLQVADGAAVSVWRSNAGDADAVSSGGQAPVFVSSGIGGVPSVRFDGVDDYLSLGAGFDDFTAGMSMFVVAQPSVLQPGSKLVALGNGAGQQNIGFGRAGSSSGLQYFTTQSGGSFGWFDTSGGLVAGEAAVYSVSQAGGVPDSVVTASVRRDGVELGSGSVYVPPVATRGVNYIGKSYWSDGAFQGDVAEVLIYDRELTPAEYATVTEYLSTKYSIGT
jgi:fibronectin type 3 domain-containing protein